MLIHKIDVAPPAHFNLPLIARLAMNRKFGAVLTQAAFIQIILGNLTFEHVVEIKAVLEQILTVAQVVFFLSCFKLDLLSFAHD